MAHHAGDQPVGAALGPPHAAIHLQLVDQRVDARRLHRVAADQQRVEAQRLAQLLVLDEAGDHRIDAAIGLLLGERGRSLEHRFEIEEGHRAQLDVAFLVNPGGVFEEALVAFDVLGVELRDLREQLFMVVRIVEIRAVRPVEAVERLDRDQLDILRDVVARECPEFLEAIGIGDDRGPAVESEGARVGVLLPVIGAPAGLVAALDHGRGDPSALQSDGEREAAETGPDNACCAAFSHCRQFLLVGRAAGGAMPARAGHGGSGPAACRSRP